MGNADRVAVRQPGPPRRGEHPRPDPVSHVRVPPLSLAEPRPAGGGRLQSPIAESLCLCPQQPGEVYRPAGARRGLHLGGHNPDLSRAASHPDCLDGFFVVCRLVSLAAALGPVRAAMESNNLYLHSTRTRHGLRAGTPEHLNPGAYCRIGPRAPRGAKRPGAGL